MPLSQTEGLLAFVYDIYTKEDKARAFKTSPGSLMEQYRLTLDQQRVIWETGLSMDAPENKEAWLALGSGKAVPSPASTYKDTEYPNAGPMALFGAMLVDVLSGVPQWEDAW